MSELHARFDAQYGGVELTYGGQPVQFWPLTEDGKAKFAASPHAVDTFVAARLRELFGLLDGKGV